MKVIGSEIMGLLGWVKTHVGAPDKVNEAVRLIEQGNFLEDQGRLELAQELYDKAIRLAPDFSRGYLNRGNVLFAKGEESEALGAYSAALACDPEYAQAHFNAGNAHRRLGSIDMAMVCYRRALELKPDFADAEVALGGVLQDSGVLEGAEERYRRAIAIKPDYAGAHRNLGDILLQLERPDDAAESLRRAITYNPDDLMVYVRLGETLAKLGQRDEAVSVCRLALERGPSSLDSSFALGRIFFELGEYRDSMASFRHALAIKPDRAETYNCMGQVMHALGRADDSVDFCRKAVALEPGYALGYTSLANALSSSGHFDAAEESFRKALELAPDLLEAQSSFLFFRNLRCDRDTVQMIDAAKRYGRLAAKKARSYTAWENTPDPHRRLKIGLVSSDLRTHAVGYFLERVLEATVHAAAGRLEFFAYSNSPCNDETSQRLRACCKGWLYVDGLSDEALSQRIRADGIDILIDLSGHTSNNRLPMFSWKPAPVQVTWLGYFATTGVAEIDYLIADPWTLTEREEMHFTEAIWRLPETRLCFTAPNVGVDVGPLPAIADGFVTFGCFNNISKVTDDVVHLWSRVLSAVPGSRLFLKSLVLQEASVQKGIVDRFAERGISSGRLVLEGGSPRPEYFMAHHRIDIALDPFPYTGGATTVEALWMGVPVLTLEGESFLSRQGVGLLMNAGLPEWVAKDQDDYVTKAVRHAGNLEKLAMLRGQLRQQVLSSPVLDATRFAEHFEAALRGMWTCWCDKDSTE